MSLAINSLVIEKLNPNLHDRNNFSCGIEILDIYLKERANKEKKNDLSVTYVATISAAINSIYKKPIAGYFTLSNHSLNRNIAPEIVQKSVPITYEIPSILIGRLAVNKDHQKQGLGQFLLKNAMLKIIDVAEISGVKCISVMAKNEDAIIFYQKYGFIKLKDTNVMIIPVRTVIKSMDQLL